MSLHDPATRRVITALASLADLAEAASKHRTAEWLRACIESYPNFPAAPRYKGPLQDLDALTDNALTELAAAIVAEQAKRQPHPAPRGGAAQWREG